MSNAIKTGLSDVLSGLGMHELWRMLAWSEIVQRYRRSSLGPFWITISMAISVGVLGPLYGTLFNQDLAHYVPYLAVGMVVWSLISNMITDCSNAFIMSEGFVKEFDLPISLYVYRVVYRNFLIAGHNMIVVLLVLLVYPPDLGLNLLFVPAGLLLIAIFGVFVGLIFGVLGTRFRDIQQLIGNLLMLMFFITPIMWRPTMLREHEWVLNYNPLYCLVQIVRAPLMGEPLGFWITANLLVVTVVSGLVSLFVFGKYRNRIAYWL